VSCGAWRISGSPLQNYPERDNLIRSQMPTPVPPASFGDTALVRIARTAGRLPFFASLRVRLLLLVALALLPALILIIYTAVDQRRQGIQAAEDDALRVVRMASDLQDQFLEGTRQLLTVLVNRGIIQGHDREGAHQMFTNIMASHPVYANLGAIKPDGWAFASGVPTEGPVFMGDQSYFQLATNTRAFAIGDYQLARITKRATVNVAAPAFDSAGQLRAVVFAALDLSWLYNLITNSALPAGSSLTVLDRNRVTLVRYPDPKGEYVGQQLAFRQRNTNDPPSPRERVRVGQSRDGMWKLYASTGLGHQDQRAVSVTVGIPLAAAYGPANRMLARNLLFLALAATLATGAAWFGGDLFILRRVRSLLWATRRVAAGDLAVRTGETADAGELYELARAFDEMTGKLQQRSLERDKAETDLRKLNEELEERVAHRTADLQRSNEELEQFAYVVSHDLQEPLRMVTQYLQLLERRYPEKLDQNARDFIGFAKDGADRMQALIKGLLEYSRVGTRPKEFGPVETEKAFQDAVSNLTVMVEENDAKITHDQLPKVQGDPVQLTQLFQNLIGNAIKFRNEVTPVVHIGAQRSNGNWQFYVRDNGIGIAKKDFDRIFVVFQRLHTRNKYPGTGIGLAACKKIVDRHGGKIWVESEPGKGSTFFFTLPPV
jgi:signal transduction histidine kinase